MPDKYSFAPFDDSMSDIIRHLCPLGFRRRQIGLLDGNELTMLVLAWRVRPIDIFVMAVTAAARALSHTSDRGLDGEIR